MTTPSPTGAVIRRSAFLDALAAATSSAPILIGLLLVAAAFVASARLIAIVPLAAMSGFVGGAHFRRVAPRSAYLSTAAVFMAFLLLVLVRFGKPYPLDVDAWGNAAAAALAAVGFVVAWRPPRMVSITLVLVVGLVVATTVVSPLGVRHASLPWLAPALGATSLLVAHLAATRHEVGALSVTVAALATALYVTLSREGSVADTGQRTGATLGVFVVSPVAGMFVARLEDGVAADAGTRLVVVCQRHPWRTSIVMAAAITCLAGPWARAGFLLEGIFDIQTALLVVPVAFALLWHVGRGNRTAFDRFAPWATAMAAAMIAAALFTKIGAWHYRWDATLAVTAPLALWPLACGVLLPGDPPGDETPFAVLAFAATLVLIPRAVSWIVPPADEWAVAAGVSILLMPLAFHAVVRSRIASWQIVGGAVAVGVLAELLRPSTARFGGWTYSRPIRLGPLVPVVWLVAGLCAVAARRARSMTAVPLDHPVVEDFGGE